MMAARRSHVGGSQACLTCHSPALAPLLCPGAGATCLIVCSGSRRRSMPTCQWSSSSGMCWASMSRRSSRRGQVRLLLGMAGCGFEWTAGGTSLAAGSLPAHQRQSMATTGTLSSLLRTPCHRFRRTAHHPLADQACVLCGHHCAAPCQPARQGVGVPAGPAGAVRPDRWGGAMAREGGRAGGWVGAKLGRCVPVLHGLALPNAAAGAQPMRAANPPPTAPPPADAALQHIAAVCGPRYNPNKGLLKLTSDRYEHREANRAHIRKVGHWMHS